MMANTPILSILTFLPLVGAAVLMFLPEHANKAVKWTGLIVSALVCIVSLYVLSLFQGGTYHFQMVEQAEWLPSLGISYKLGIDGISIWLVVLSTFLMVVSSAFSFYIDKRVKLYFISMLLLETAVLGVFLAVVVGMQAGMAANATFDTARKGGLDYRTSRNQ